LSNDSGITWTPVAPLTDESLWSVTYGNNRFVAVGDWGSILTSTDGTTWKLKNLNSTQPIHSVIYADNRFVAAGDSGFIYTSTDGSVWTRAPVGIAASLTDIIYAGNRFVAVGYEGIILTSSDGAAWKLTKSGSNNFYSVAYGNGKYIAVGPSTIFTSADGLIWSKKYPEINTSLNSITFGKNQFVAVGYAGTIIALKSDFTGTTFPNMSASQIGFKAKPFVKFGRCYDLLGRSIIKKGNSSGTKNMPIVNQSAFQRQKTGLASKVYLIETVTTDNTSTVSAQSVQKSILR
jgi:hypothetical protein